jgi:hypothetical protein
MALAREKRLLVLVLHDEEIPYVGLENAVILRTSLVASHRQPNEWVLPYSWESRSDPFLPSAETEQPTIGFCGLSNRYRHSLLSYFSCAHGVKTNFILREQFWGGHPHDPGVMADFWNNLLNNQFAIAARGTGNFSMRFYQAMSVGRIPVLVNTDMVLPLDSVIDWQNTIVFEDSPEACLKKVKAIHYGGETTNWQKRCYEVYHKYLAIEKFLPHLIAHLPTELLQFKHSKRGFFRF